MKPAVIIVRARTAFALRWPLAVGRRGVIILRRKQACGSAERQREEEWFCFHDVMCLLFISVSAVRTNMMRQGFRLGYRKCCRTAQTGYQWLSVRSHVNYLAGH